MKDGISAAGDDLASVSSDTLSDGPKSSHHLLRHKLTLDEGTSGSTAAEREIGKEKRKKKPRRKSMSCKDISNIN